MLGGARENDSARRRTTRATVGFPKAPGSLCFRKQLFGCADLFVREIVDLERTLFAKSVSVRPVRVQLAYLPTRADIPENLRVQPIVVGIVINSPALLTWNSEPGLRYEVQYTTPSLLTGPDPWTTLATVDSQGTTSQYIDLESETVGSRLYRVVLIGPAN